MVHGYGFSSSKIPFNWSLISDSINKETNSHYGNTGRRVLSGGTKLERFLPKNQHTQKELLNFENWSRGKLAKIGHHFI